MAGCLWPRIEFVRRRDRVHTHQSASTRPVKYFATLVMCRISLRFRRASGLESVGGVGEAIEDDGPDRPSKLHAGGRD